MSIPQSFLQELLARTDIVEVVGRYVPLKKGGANFMGLCPFHGEKSPSFSVSPVKQFFHCFGCGKNGNAIGFLMEHTGMGFVEAVQDLAQQAGLQVPQDEQSPQERAREAEQRQRQQTLTGVLEQAAQAYQQQLRQSPRAIAYLKGRGLSGQVAKTFGLGYAPEGWRFLSTALPDYQSPLLTEAGLVIASEAADGHSGEGKRYDRFRDRIMFPIRNLKGECIGFGGRVLDHGEPKYLNSPETPVFSKGHELYGLFEARNAIRHSGYALVTEGYMDVVALAQLGFANAVATLGTACTADHLRKLLRCTDAVVFSFDGDAAGRRAARKALEAALPWASDTRSLKFLFLPPEHDPDSYIRQHGADAFATLVQQATPLSRFLLEVAATDCDLATAEGRARLASQAQPLWHAMPDGALKRQLLPELAQQVRLQAQELGQLWQQQAAAGAHGHGGHGQHRSAARPTYNAEPPPLDHNDAEASSGSDHFSPSPRRPFRRPRQSGSSASAGGAPSPGGIVRREDRLARILLEAADGWDWLSADDQQLLGQLPAPHGLLFSWLERQWHEHGPQDPEARLAALRAEPFADWARTLLTPPPHSDASASAPNRPGGQADEVRQELRELLRREHIDHLKALETAAIAQAEHDPAALQHYRELLQQRRALERAAPRSDTDSRA